MAALDWEKINLNATVDEEQLWELLPAAKEQVQEMAHAVWAQEAWGKLSFGVYLIEEMIPARPSNMPLRVQL